MNTEVKARTITLTNSPPVRIVEDAWPCIASSNRHWLDVGPSDEVRDARDAWIRVRAHADGRHIAYGSWLYDSKVLHGRDVGGKAGEVVAAGADVVTAIRAVATTLRELAGESDDRSLIDTVERECIASLPAVPLN